VAEITAALGCILLLVSKLNTKVSPAIPVTAARDGASTAVVTALVASSKAEVKLFLLAFEDMMLVNVNMR